MSKRIFLTIDTECHCIERVNQYIYGKTKGGEEYGIKRILEIGKELDIPLNFFVDIPEWRRYGEKYVQNIVDLIHSYNQTICFHFHPNYASGDEKRWNLYQYSLDEQNKLLSQGLEDYYRFCGKKDTLIFRAGCYGINMDTLEALKGLGVNCVDLSYGYGDGTGMCHLSATDVGVKNIPIMKNGILIRPNTSYVGFRYFGYVKNYGVNVAETPLFEFKRFIDRTQLEDIIYTMHSWDLILKWSFIRTRVWGNKIYIRRLKKAVQYAQVRGFVFSSLENYEVSNNEKDELVDLCRTPFDKIKCLIANYIRFWGVTHFKPVYLVFYIPSFLLLISISVFTVYLIIN